MRQGYVAHRICRGSGVNGLPNPYSHEGRGQGVTCLGRHPCSLSRRGIVALRVGAYHLHVTRKYLADHCPFENDLTLANALRRTARHTITATHNPSHRIARHTGASCDVT